MDIIYSKCYNGVIMVGGFADGTAREPERCDNMNKPLAEDHSDFKLTILLVGLLTALL